MQRICELLKKLVSHNSFYQQKLKEITCSSLQEFSNRVPFTLKQELADDQRSHPPYGTNLSEGLTCYTRMSQTSASTGEPLRWLDTPESWNWMLDNWDCVYDSAGIHSSDRIFFAFSFGLFLGFWTAFDCAVRRGNLCLPGGGMSSAARLRTIVDNRVSVLCCTPTYAMRLADVAAEEQVDLSVAGVKSIIVAGEPGGSLPATRACIEKAWSGARVFDHHGMTEVGPVSFACPVRSGVLHVMESAYYAEVIDSTNGHAILPGGTGELVLTTLGRTSSPVLRYRTGDLVKISDSAVCECGRSELALEGGILGRTDDMIQVRGVNIFPSAVEQIVRACGGVAEYSVAVQAQRAMTEMSLRIEADSSCKDAEGMARRLEGALNQAFSLRIPVVVVPTGTLPRFEMKARRWIRSQM